MALHCGIVGLPNVGKSTLFNALTQGGAAAENFPFCTVDPNTGIVAVPDPRLDRIAELVRPEKTIPAMMQFVDIAGLVAGASRGEGLGNRFLANIREADAIVHVVRCFEDPNITHVSGRIDPVDDMQVISTELALADLESVEKQTERVRRVAKGGDKEALRQLPLLEQLLEWLGAGRSARTMPLADGQQALLKEFHLLTAKPVLCVANIAEGPAADSPQLTAVEELAREEGGMLLPLAVKLEAEIAELPAAEQGEMLQALDLEETGLARVIRSSYALLGLHTFFTAGPKELRAWPLLEGATAAAAAGSVHSDFERAFIRAEVVSYKDFIACGGEHAAREAGKWRLEGRDYIVCDGDVMHFRHGA